MGRTLRHPGVVGHHPLSAMSTRQTGNRHENSVMEMAEALGYATFAARGSRDSLKK